MHRLQIDPLIRWQMAACRLAILLAAAGAVALPPSVIIEGVPHIRQKPDFCGEACVAMFLRKLGADTDQDYVFNRSGLDPLQARGCYSAELATSLKRLGFRPGNVWHRLDAKKAPEQLGALFTDLHRDLQRGIPSIVCMRYDANPGAAEHFRLVLGYDADRDAVIYHEPAVDDGAYLRMPRHDFMALWPLKYKPDTWTVIRMSLAADPTAAPRGDAAKSTGLTAADFAQHLMLLKPRLPAGFHLVLQPPFVVIGDESAAGVQRRATGTVKWAVDRLKADFFSQDPTEILDIWLFKDRASYLKHTSLLFGHAPDTPYGYYSETDGALIMNIATGGGTLVHEIVHPFMAANFPDCPAWLNEGLGSLYEQSSERNGHIVGLTNWRLAGLQAAIAADRVPSFETLCGNSNSAFYERDPGTNYAQARYLCYYLQEKGLLVKYYHAFRRDAATDPTGYKTLMAVLGDPDPDQFQQIWQRYVSRLKF